MTEQALTPQLAMQRDLKPLPQTQLPPKFSIRSFQPGDEAAWERIIADSFKKDIQFRELMTKDKRFSPERVLFVLFEGLAIGTASAWYTDTDEQTGYLHMVGVHSAHTGKGIGYQISLAAMHQMVREGRSKVSLHTDDFRLPAIKTYLNLGFKPQIVHENQVQRWKDISLKLGCKDNLLWNG